eukprot:500697_1
MSGESHVDITFEIFTSETDSNDTGSETNDTETNDTDDDDDVSLSTHTSDIETDTYESTSTDQSQSGHRRMLSIDQVILQPILDSPIIEDKVIAKEDEYEKENDCKSSDSKTLKCILNGKSKPIKSVKAWNGFTNLLSLFASNSIIKEKQIKKICHKEIIELLSNKNNSKQV